MTLFIDLRASRSGGICAPGATVWNDGTQLLTDGDFAARVRGRDLVLATHGFNVDRDEGILALSAWERLCRLPANALFAGVLWPGDSKYLPVLDYPVEGDEAIASGRHLAAYLNAQAAAAASVSFVSHSLGARMVLEALRGLQREARRLMLMAGAIEDDCLANEYREAANKAREIVVLSSRSDWVLEFAFPLGNPVGEIIMHGHPYFKTALGRDGPAQPIPPDQRGGVWQIPDKWKYVHADYLPKSAAGSAVPPPAAEPAPGAPEPADKPAWSACVLSTIV
jgi:alpha/beta hydrolase family protein DUF900